MTRRSLLMVCTLTLSALVLPLSAAEPPGVSRTVILGTNSVWLNKNTRVGDGATLPGGDVIANAKNLDGVVLNAGVEMSIARDVQINDAAGTSNVIEVKADSILLDRDSLIDGDAHYNDLTTGQGSVITGTRFPSLITPVLTLPAFRTAVPGALNITVNAANSPYLLAPGAYNNITVAANATLVLAGGVYHARSVAQGAGGSILFDAATDRRGLERLDSGKDSRVGPSAAATIDASDVVVYVAGANGGAGLPLSLPSAAKFGQGSDVDANVYAPNGTIRVDRNSAVTGSLFARDVLIDQSGLLVLSSFSNKAPDAVDDAVAVDQGGTVDGNVLANDSDPNPDDVLTVTVPQQSGPSYGVLTLAADGTFSYTHAGDGLATDQFVYQVCDDGVPVKCDTATVSITIIPVNDPPIARADAIRVSPGGTATTLFPSGTSLLANDSDPEGDNLSLTTTPVSGPDHGSLTLAADGTFSYTHAGDGSTTDQFVYEVCDDGTPIRCATATVFIEIAPATMLVSITISGNGSVVSSPAGIDCGATCSATFDTANDLPINLFATPDPGYAFDSWDPDLSDPDCLDGRLTVAADASCAAVFVEPAPPTGDPVTVTVTLAGAGAGTVTSVPEGISCPFDCSFVFAFGTRVSLLAEPEADSTFVGFSGVGDCLDGELDGTSSVGCGATFDLLPAVRWTLAIQFEGDGTGDVTSAGGEIGCSDDCSALFGDGSIVVLNARPTESSTFGGFSGDCGEVSGFEATIPMGADTTCTATFLDGPQ